jgi:hypothetical protein
MRRRMTYRHLILLPGLLVAGCTAQAQREDPYPPASRCQEVSVTQACTVYGVSLVELIANPRTYDGLRVRVIGWLRLEFEGDAIYLHRDDYTHALTKNGLWVQLGRDLPRGPECSDGYALIEGRFDARHTGHMGLWSGAIVDIDRCMPWGDRGATPPPFIPRPAP